MSKLSVSLRAHIDARRLSNKDVAATFLDELQRRAGERAVSWPTVEPKLSKLLAGSIEGEKFFFADEVRRSALAASIGLDEAELIALQAVHTLLLHPGLPAEAATYLRERADEARARHWIDSEVFAGAPEDLRVALRDRARWCPRSIVVLPDDQDRAFFDGEDIRTSTLERVARGWQLLAERDLVSLPPPPDPEMFDGDEPLFLCPSLAEERRRQRRQRYGGARHEPDRCERADLQEREPTFTLAEIEAHRRWDLESAGVSILSVGRRDGDRVFAALHGSGKDTLVWTWNRRVFVAGPAIQTVRELLGGDRCIHALEEPATFAEWRRAFDAWNPWGSIPRPQRPHVHTLDVSNPHRFLALVERTETECGLDLRPCSRAWWERATELQYPSSARAPLAEVEQEVRRELRALAAREHEVDPPSASVIFRLQAAAEAPLVDLGCTGRDRFHVLANLGAGHLLRIRCVGYPDETPERLRGSRSLLVGGDVTIFLEEEADLVLEADPVVAVRRRRREAKEAEEEKRRRDAFDDDDD